MWRAFSYCRVLPEGASDAPAERAAMGVAMSRRERIEPIVRSGQVWRGSPQGTLGLTHVKKISDDRRRA
jgi:hypothetical protein